MFARYRLGYYVLLALTALQMAVSIGFGSSPLESFIPKMGFFTRVLPVWALLPLVWAAFVSVELARRRVERPFKAIRKLLYRQRHWLLRGTVFMVVILYFGIGFTSFKTAIPSYVPFYADPWLADLDQALFGIDPWRWTHAVLGPLGTVVIDRIYVLWFLIMALYIGWFCFSRNPVLQLRGLLSYVLAWGVLGNIVALGLSSVGPCFYEHFYHDPRFAPLMDKLMATHREEPLYAVKTMNFLLRVIGQNRFGAGISAMPSLHVAIAFLCFLVGWEYGRHWWAKLLGLLFFAAIMIGSVHLAWHYALDGIVSILVTGLIWWGTGRFIAWLEAREGVRA